MLDGRDIGTKIFPDAPVKLFVTASAAARGKRRYLELIGRGLQADLADVTRDIEARDLADSTRATDPLKPAEDAMRLDTTAIDADAAFAAALELITKKLHG